MNKKSLSKNFYILFQIIVLFLLAWLLMGAGKDEKNGFYVFGSLFLGFLGLLKLGYLSDDN